MAKILVADDDPSARELIRMTLAKEEYETRISQIRLN